MQIYELTVDSKDSSKETAADMVCSGHASGELWGACAIPKQDANFVTLGDDGIVRVWDGSSHAAKACGSMKTRDDSVLGGRAVAAFTGNEGMVEICAGMSNGDVVVLKVEGTAGSWPCLLGSCMKSEMGLLRSVLLCHIGKSSCSISMQ